MPVDALLRTFLFHVGAEKVPQTVQPPTENDLSERAWAACIGLEQGFVSEFTTHPDLRSRIIGSWPGIFKWLCYLYDQRIVTEKNSDTVQARITTLCTVIRDLYRDEKVRNSIRKTPGIIALCTRFWIHQSSPLITTITFSLLQPSTCEEFNEIVDAASGNAELVAKTAIDRLRSAMNKSPMHPEHVSMLAFTITTLSQLPRHPVAFHLLANNSIWVVTRMLFLVSRVVGSSPDFDEKYLPAIRTGFTCLRGALIQDDSPRLVSQTLDAGLLRAMCGLSLLLQNHVDQTSQDVVQFILRVTLPQHMVYRSVVRIMKREQKEVDPELADLTVMRSWLREDWMSLLLITHLRSIVAKLPKEVKGKGNVTCDCVTCTVIGHKTEFLRCSGCMYVHYCSKVCQKEAWPIHRTMCKLKNHSRSNKASTRLLFSPPDAQFFRELFSTDAYVHLPHLQKLAKRKFPKEPGQNFIICLDYTNRQYPAGTCSLKSINTYEFPPLSGEEADPANVRAQNDEMIKMVRRNPTEYTFIEASFAYGPERLTRNLMIRPNIWVQPQAADLHSALNWQNNRCENHGEPAGGLLERFLAMNIGLADL
ncbi:hypothetical protein B0H10DRAFT_1819325 [Mycena sp. CBHHK59/15]|nr:hypothetical protein B0H10DRAFT_1819325 [Mycena sp. CBHHK59/15]